MICCQPCSAAQDPVLQHSVIILVMSHSMSLWCNCNHARRTAETSLQLSGALSNIWSSEKGVARNASAESPDQLALKLAPARGLFPVGCKWRAVRDAGERGRALWAVERYQYYVDALDAWTEEQPAACVVRGQPKTPECAVVLSHCSY